MSRYGQLQREMRKRAGLYLGDLSDKLGCTAAYISDIELERKKPPQPDVVKKIAHILNASKEETKRLLSLAQLARYKRTFEAHGRIEEEAEFITALARIWDGGSIPSRKLEKMRAILEEDEEID